MDWTQVFIGTLPLLGVIVGGYATYLTQIRTLKEQLNRESEKEIELRNVERFSLYSEILKLEGENLMQEYVGGGTADFNITVYTEKFRPVFFSKFYLLDQEVADKVRRMDNIIGAANFFEELEQDQNDELSILFNNIISDIENILRKYRMQS